MSNSIAAQVSKELESASQSYLEEIVSHGIHNLTNGFHGETDEDYEEFAAEFQSQAAELLSE